VAEYEVTLVEVASEECQNLEHQCLEDCTVLCTELGIDHYEYQMCEAHEWKDFKFQVTEDHLLHALNVEVRMAREPSVAPVARWMRSDRKLATETDRQFAALTCGGSCR
jgi:hypothetical protein